MCIAAQLSPTCTGFSDSPSLLSAVLGAYVGLGGPAPLGTLLVGSPCFFVYWLCLWRFLINPEGASTEQQNAGKRLIICFAALVGQLVSYAIITIVMLQSESDEVTQLLAIGFAVVNGLIMQIDIRGFIFDGARPNKSTSFPSHDQWLAARLFPLNFICLHLTYFNFLFPVLAEGPAVAIGAIATVLVNSRPPDFSAAMVPDEVAEGIYSRYLLLIASTVCPLLFGLLLSFDHWGWNAGMFFILSDMCDDAVWKALMGCFINWLASAVSIAVYASAVMKRLREVGESMHTDQATEYRVPRNLLATFLVILSFDLLDQYTPILRTDEKCEKFVCGAGGGDLPRGARSVDILALARTYFAQRGRNPYCGPAGAY